MAITALSDLNGLYNTIYERALFVAREQNLMSNLVDQRSATGWMNRVIPIRAQVSAVTVAETTDYASPTTMSKTAKATLTPGEIIAQALLTDIMMDTDPDSAVSDTAMELGGAVATKIDEDLTAEFANFTTDKGTGAGLAFTLASLATGYATLVNAKALQYGAINAVLHPFHYHDIWLELGQPDTNFLNAERDNALVNYFRGQLVGANIYISANIAVDVSDDAVSGMFNTPAIMLDTRRAPRLEPDRDASARATEWNMTAGYATGVVRDEFGVGLTADATAP